MKFKKMSLERKAIAVLFGLIAGGMIYDQILKKKIMTDYEFASSTVRVVNVSMSSGGTGVIVASSDSESTILTNAHVCKVVERGGLVVLENGTAHKVMSYKASKQHDLCFVKILANAGKSVKLASSEPDLYTKSYISGHPLLLPTVVSSGHFSGNTIIELMFDVKECTEEDFKNPETALICAIFGALPVLRTFETQLVTALIMPGSSGSPVFTEAGELAGLVFAGAGRGFSYAFTVPYGAVHSFMYEESNSIEYTQVSDSRVFKLKLGPDFFKQVKGFCNGDQETLDSLNNQETRDRIKKVRKILNKKSIKRLNDLCDSIAKRTLWDRI